ncbi:neutral alpha-glucosidase ab precursor (glucosidase II alpha subunit) (alpha glucosidase 2) [Purpureocillium lilacinum]|uniref:alpha-glucosidase n=1 Tax=Purpureocillium lilacinum TaxID=33203 RepID=A0A179GTD1_PURLI|nr:neutral alpha-glucosidase ab precursor (glucosidase II alpha subunit) (alpha glucosidase 2) [Purpureocillium lilacinum]
MPQKEYAPEAWALEPATDSSTPKISLRNNDKTSAFTFTLEAIRTNVFRTTFTSDTHLLPPHPSIPRQALESQLSPGSATVEQTDNKKSFRLGDVSASVDWSDGAPLVTINLKGSESALHEDVPHRSYAVNGAGVAHYSRYRRNTLHVGLGEKAAPMDLSGRRFQLSATDSFGYDVYRTDPLYKNIPLLINATPSGCIALFSTAHTRGEYSIGAEMDGMWGHYKVYRQDYGGLEEIIIVGKTLKDIVGTYAQLAGFPLLVPRWAFGYLSGGMKYSMLDDPPASEALLELARKMKEYDIPCSAYQMSSGYTVAETPPKTRNVFTWNRHRFSDPEGFIKEYHKLGMRLIANVKPYVLANHPEYGKLKAAGALFKDPRTGDTAVTRLWSAGGGESGEGGHIDFTSAAGFKWWYEGVRQLRREGIDCIWNDNNEYTITDDEWQCALDEPSVRDASDTAKARPQVGLWGRNLHTELHGKASHDALLDEDPDSRPFVLTRSATAGTLRYACSSWSGDNVTSWPGMKGANAIALNAGFSLMHCYGHDVGGFEGPQPSPELLVRWVQLGAMSPRFAINCFKTGGDNNVGDVIEPWMHPEVTPLVRQAIKRRYEMIPYLYSLMLVSHQEAVPPQRWTGWGYEADPEVWTNKTITDGETQYWLGDALLVGGVYEPGVSQASVYLPKAGDDDEGFININSPYEHFEAGRWATIDAQWHGAGIPVLAKVGSAIPIGRDAQVLSPGEKENVANLPLDDYRGVEIFPPPKGKGVDGRWYKTTWYEDDGVSTVRKNRVSSYTIAYRVQGSVVEVTFARDESFGFVAPWKSLTIILPVGDMRDLTIEGQDVELVGTDKAGRRSFRIAV